MEKSRPKRSPCSWRRWIFRRRSKWFSWASELARADWNSLLIARKRAGPPQSGSIRPHRNFFRRRKICWHWQRDFSRRRPLESAEEKRLETGAVEIRIVGLFVFPRVAEHRHVDAALAVVSHPVHWLAFLHALRPRVGEDCQFAAAHHRFGSALAVRELFARMHPVDRKSTRL